MASEILKKHGLTLNTFFDATEIEEAGKGATVSFEQALDKAITAIKIDDKDPESLLALVKENDGDDSKLLEYLNGKGSLLALVARNIDEDDDDARKNGQWPPENGESRESNWVFLLKAPSFSDHLIWSIVDKQSGKTTTYGFN